MERRQNQRSGQALVEFALVGIPLAFIWISVVQMGIGEWRYHTLQYAVKMTSTYMATHGANCGASGNSCSITIANAAQVMEAAAVGIPASTISMTFTPYKSDHVTAATSPYPVTCTLDNCLTNSTTYPPTGFGTASKSGSPGSDIRVTAKYTFVAGLAIFMPGAGSVQFGSYTFASDSQQTHTF